jgi:D-cysteine desulfhydrase family pyridoxal phosphate-dependent enzyme
MRNLPRLRFALLPTAIEPLPRLSAALQGPQIFVKRDDQTGLAFGGNKTRKLEFLLAEAQANGARTLITIGAVQSNHCRQTAAAATKYGFECILVLEGKPPESPSGNLFLDRLLGAEIVWCEPADHESVLNQTFNQAWEDGRRPYLIPLGGSNATGAVAYAMAIKEMLEQDFVPDWIVFPTASGGTQAGLVAGASLFGFSGGILGIQIAKFEKITLEVIASLAEEITELLGDERSFDAEELRVNSDYLGEAYGVMGRAEREAINLFARQEGLLLDPVYTGKAGAGLIDLIRKHFFPKDQKVLFWHTGGTPTLLADEYRDLLA